jgi:hypothetical protein
MGNASNISSSSWYLMDTLPSALQGVSKGKTERVMVYITLSVFPLLTLVLF